MELFYPVRIFAETAVNILNFEGRLGEAVSFFIYDSIKILLLLFIMVFILGYLRTYISTKTLRGWMNKKYGLAYLGAAIFGAITPFCSCSSIPLFFSFIRSRIPLGVSFCFLITSPIINQYVAVIMLAAFGLKITVLYIASGMLIGMVSGKILEMLGLEKYLDKKITCSKKEEPVFVSFKERVSFGLDEAVSLTKDLWLWILAGVAIGAFLHGYVPEDTIHNLISKGGIFTVPLAVLLGIPIYANCAAIVPVAEVLFDKGVPLGTALAFMMSASALSLPEAIILKKAMNTKLLLIFFAVVGMGVVLIGLLFNMFI